MLLEICSVLGVVLCVHRCKFACVTMNVLCIFLCVYFVTSSVLRWITLGESFGHFGQFLHVSGSAITNTQNQSPVKYTYSRDQLWSIGFTVSNNRGLSRLDPSVCYVVNKLNIARGRKKRRKRGGKSKTFPKASGVNLDNLVYPPKCNSLNKPSENVTCMTLNCRSVVNKDVLVGQLLREEKTDFALLTETWYSDEKQHQYESSDLNQNGYRISVANRQNRIGGGIALTYRTTANVRRLSADMSGSFEYGVWQLTLKNITIHIVGIYRPPSLATPVQFVSDFFQFMEGIVAEYSNLMVMGDFNLNINDHSNALSEFNNSLFALGLEQHVDFSTHIGGNSLDLVISEASNGVNIISCEPNSFVSDHCAVKIITNVKKENIISKSVTFRNFKNMNNSAFSSDLSKLSIECEHIDSFIEQFEGEIKNILDTHAPLEDKMKIYRAPKPWFSDDILHLKRLLRKSERLWRKYRQPHQYELFKTARNKYNYEINQAKRLTLSQKIVDFKGDSKKLYKFVSELTGKNTDNPMPTSVNDDNTLADEFADHFMAKIDKIRQSLEKFDNFIPKQKDVPCFDNFVKLTESEIKKLISEMQTKSSELDILPTHVLKLFLQELLPTITQLVNLSLNQGVFPAKWKQAIVRPLLKKVGLELQFSNYRPVSNLSFLSKLIEKAVLLRLNAHVAKFDLLPKNQSAYRQYHSCETALLRLVNDLLEAMEHQEVTALIAIDLSAAFDTVDHDILLDVLRCQYGVSGTALEWVDSYLRPRSCRVSVDSILSSPRVLQCSVPQGSCLGPWLYLTYAGTLFDIVPSTISVYGFADDHTANKRFQPASLSVERTAIQELERCALTINTWMNENKLKMNGSKTEFIMFGSRQQLAKCSTRVVDIAGDQIERQECIRYLGAFLDETLKFKEHVRRKCRTAMINYFKIKSIRKYLTKEATEILVLSLVISHLDYCNVILYGIAQCELNKLQRIQNMCAKLVLFRSKYDSSKQALFDLHWLPVKARITFKMLTIMYNCSTGHAPAYLTDLLSQSAPGRSLRSSDKATDNYNVPFNRRKTFGDRSFSAIGPKLWNELPLSLRKSESLNTFKKNLKTHYFRSFYQLF